MRAALRGALRYRGMLVIALWQVPVGPTAGPDGSISLLFGGGYDEVVPFLSCDPGAVRRVAYRTAATEFDYNVSREVRVEVAAAAFTSDSQDGMPLFAGVRVRSDWSKFGVGAGVVTIPLLHPEFDIHGLGPSAYLRLGPAEGVHGRADLWPVAALGSQHVLRAGVGWNATARHRPSGFLGVAMVGTDGDAQGVAGELTIPVHERAALRIVGHMGKGTENTVAGLAVGGRFLLQ
ncbi:hypothetical protein BH23GEM9_BH23GEM9_07760 [soil metagenome]